jgi:hypothetical protein
VENVMVSDFFIQTYQPLRFSLFLSLFASPAVGLVLFLLNFMPDSHTGMGAQPEDLTQERVRDDLKELK